MDDGGLSLLPEIFCVKLHFTLEESLLQSFFIWILSATKL